MFTLWIVWHGWWADRRDVTSRWTRSPFIVEIPFRVVIELGFFTIFPWLVSFNPPPWNPDYTWNLVPLSWMTTVAIKHTFTSYILLLASYVALSLGPVRKVFGLRKKIAQRDTHIIYAGALLIGLLLWTAEAWFHYHFSNVTGRTFWDIAILDVGSHDAFMRFLYIVLALMGAATLNLLVHRRARLQQSFDHQNKVLAAIRNLTKLITREKDRDKLLQGTCDCLVETRGYHNAWIVLLDTTGEYLTHAQSGRSENFSKMAERLHAGSLTECSRRALQTPEIILTPNPDQTCTDCPLSQNVYDATTQSCKHGLWTSYSIPA